MLLDRRGFVGAKEIRPTTERFSQDPVNVYGTSHPSSRRFDFPSERLCEQNVGAVENLPRARFDRSDGISERRASKTVNGKRLVTTKEMTDHRIQAIMMIMIETKLMVII